MTSRALVLGGGGAAGNAWLIGVVAGLHRGGIDLADADLIVGTSAGATAALQITGRAPASLLDDILAAPAPNRYPHVAKHPTGDFLELTSEAIAAAADQTDMRRRLGAMSLATDPDWSDTAIAERRAVVASRLPSQAWPSRLVHLVAVNARTGESAVFDRAGGVEPADAVAASTAAVGAAPAHRIGDDRFIDGAYRLNENADLAAGHDRVLVLSPLGGRTRQPAAWQSDLAAQVRALRAGGSRVQTILPDDASRTAFGGNMMSPLARPPAARAGRDQGLALALDLTEFWS